MVTLDEAVRAVQVSVGSGIVGAVAESGTPIRIADAYADSRFNPDVDRDTGFRTGSIMAHPVRDAGGNIVGVLQAMNRLADGSHGEPAPGGFTDADESLCAMLSLHIGVALRNVMVFESAVRARAKTDATLSLVRALHESAPSASSLMFSIHSKTPRIVDAERCSLFLADHQHSELWAIQGEVDVRMPMDRGFIGHVATTKATLNVPDAYADARWSGEAMDKKSGFRTKAVLCMPLLGSGGRLVGVVQCINKVPSSGREAFDRQDEEVLATLLALVAPIIEKSALFRSHSSAAADAEGSEFSGRAMTGDHAASAAASAQPAIAEEEEEEEDEGGPFRLCVETIREFYDSGAPAKEAPLQLMAEPGRFMVETCQTLVAGVIGRRDDSFLDELDDAPPAEAGGPPAVRLFINDGLYGSFNNVLYDHASPAPMALRSKATASEESLRLALERARPVLPVPSTGGVVNADAAMSAAHAAADAASAAAMAVSRFSVSAAAAEAESANVTASAAHQGASIAMNAAAKAVAAEGSSASSESSEDEGEVGGPAREEVSLWGQTCDGIDCIAERIWLPRGLETGDWLVFDSMGAYTKAAACAFNGFDIPESVYIQGDEEFDFDAAAEEGDSDDAYEPHRLARMRRAKRRRAIRRIAQAAASSASARVQAAVAEAALEPERR